MNQSLSEILNKDNPIFTEEELQIAKTEGWKFVEKKFGADTEIVVEHVKGTSLRNVHEVYEFLIEKVEEESELHIKAMNFLKEMNPMEYSHRMAFYQKDMEEKANAA